MADRNDPANQPPQESSDPPVTQLSDSDAHIDLAAFLRATALNDSLQQHPSQKEYKFWSTQPVPQMHHADQMQAIQHVGEPIEIKSIQSVPTHPYALINEFEWSEIIVTDDKQLEETYKLLNENYVEDGAAMFRFDYSRQFLRWALMPPGWQSSWHVGVRVKRNKKLVAFISAIPATVSVHAKPLAMVEINFLCVHKKLRSKRLAPVLIREITRRVNLHNIWQAVYTAGALLPSPVSVSNYYHRALNPKKLIQVGFSRLKPRMTIARTVKLLALKSDTETPGIRPMTFDDTVEACDLVKQHMSQYDLHVEMTLEDIRHWLLPRQGVIYTYVVQDPQSNAITDLVSFYSLPSSVINHPTHKSLNAAYAFCIVPNKTPIKTLMKDALVLAHNNHFDVFNALDLAQNAQFFDDLKFSVGDGSLNYYLYNWKCRPIPKEKNALILL